MKKKMFGGFAIVAIAVAVAFNVSVSNQKSDKASMLALANVEVLAEAEGTVTLPCETCLVCKCTFDARLKDGTIVSVTTDKTKKS